MKKRLISNDFIIEILLGILTLIMALLLVSGLFLIVIMPITNYYHTTGQIVFKSQCKIASEFEGVVTKVYVENNSYIQKSQPVIQFRSESYSREIRELNVRLQYLKTELSTMQRLFQIGSVNKVEVDKKMLEIEEISMRIHNLERNTINAPISGIIYYSVLPDHVLGNYIEKGEVIGYIHTDETKQVRISISNTMADRFKIGGSVLLKYKDPVSFKTQRMKGVIYKYFVNEKERSIELYCDITEGKDHLDLFQPFTMIDAAIILNSTSICNDIFGIDPFPGIITYIKQKKWFLTVRSFLGINELPKF